MLLARLDWPPQTVVPLYPRTHECTQDTDTDAAVKHARRRQREDIPTNDGAHTPSAQDDMHSAKLANTPRIAATGHSLAAHDISVATAHRGVTVPTHADIDDGAVVTHASCQQG